MHQQVRLLFCSALLFLFMSGKTFGQAGMLDSSFGINGSLLYGVAGLTTTNATGIILSHDTSYLIGGKVSSQSCCSDIAAFHVFHNGTLDQTFGNNNGVAAYNVLNRTFAHDIALQRDGRILLCGQDYDPVPDTEDIGIVRLLPNGKIDSTLDGDGRVLKNYGLREESHGILEQPDGKIVFSGHTNFYAPTNTIGDYANNLFIAQLKANGETDSSFALNGIYTLTFDTSSDYSKFVTTDYMGNILACGTTCLDAICRGLVVRLTPEGVPDSTFGGDGAATLDVMNGSVAFYRLAMQNDNKILAGGQIATSSAGFDFVVARFLPNGVVDSSFATNGYFRLDAGYGDERLEDIDLQSDGKIFCIGWTTDDQFHGDAVNFRLLPDGTLDPAFANNGVNILNLTPGYDEAKSSVIDMDGNILVAGYAHDTTGDGGRMFVYRLFNDCGPAYSVIAQSATTMCANDSVMLTITPSANTYQWFRDGSLISGATNVSYVAVETGFYYAEVTNDCNTSQSNPLYVKVFSTQATITPSGNVVINEGQSIVLQANIGNNFIYQWYLDGVPVPGATNDSYEATQAGDYVVRIVYETFCVTFSAATTIEVITGLPNVKEDIQLYPNPTGGEIAVTMSGLSSAVLEYRLYNAVGKECSGGVINTDGNTNTVRLDFSNMNDGIYFLQFGSQQFISQKSIVINQ